VHERMTKHAPKSVSTHCRHEPHKSRIPLKYRFNQGNYSSCTARPHYWSFIFFCFIHKHLLSFRNILHTEWLRNLRPPTVCTSNQAAYCVLHISQTQVWNRSYAQLIKRHVMKVCGGVEIQLHHSWLATSRNFNNFTCILGFSKDSRNFYHWRPIRLVYFWLWAGRSRGWSSSPGRVKNFHFPMLSRSSLGSIK
jgi:hypothetical protein